MERTGNMGSDRPLAMSFQLIIDDRKRLCAEIEVVWESGETTFKRIDANERLTLHFDDLLPDARPP